MLENHTAETEQKTSGRAELRYACLPYYSKGHNKAGRITSHEQQYEIKHWKILAIKQYVIGKGL